MKPTNKIKFYGDEALRLQKLQTLAQDQLLDAQIAFDDVTRECKDAWDSYWKVVKSQVKKQLNK